MENFGNSAGSRGKFGYQWVKYSIVRMTEFAHIKAIKFVKLHNKCALVREGPGYPETILLWACPFWH